MGTSDLYYMRWKATAEIWERSQDLSQAAEVSLWLMGRDELKETEINLEGGMPLDRPCRGQTKAGGGYKRLMSGYIRDVFSK